MPTPDTAFKQLLLNALTTPQVKLFPTNKIAHKQRFAMYNAMRVMRQSKPPDPFGNMKDVLEFIVRPARNGPVDGQWELRIQRKSTQLIDALDGWEADTPYANPQGNVPFTGPTPTPPPAIDVSALQHQLKNETPQELDASSPEGQRILRRLEINDWAETYCDNHPQMNFMQLMAAINQLPSSTSLQEAQRLLRDAGVIE